MIRAWLKKRAERATQKRHKAGYDYAAGVLLSTQGAVDTIRDLEAEADGIFDRDEFDRGIMAAIRDWWEIAYTRRNYERLATIAEFARTTSIYDPASAQAFKTRVEDLARGA